MWEGDAGQPSRDDPDHSDALCRTQVKQGGQGGGDDHCNEVRGSFGAKRRRSRMPMMTPTPMARSTMLASPSACHSWPAIVIAS